MNRSFFPFAIIVALCSGTASAQTYPTKPIRLIAPFGAGGPADQITRTYGRELTEVLGQQVIVDNRAGAAGIIGTEVAAKAARDGYTLIMGTSSTHAIAPLLFPSLPYDPVRDFTPIAPVAAAPNILTTSPRLVANNLRELVALAKAKPGQINYASNGTGTTIQLTSELFASMAGIKITHVPYKDTAVAIGDMVQGQVGIMFSSTLTALPRVKAGIVRGIAITSNERSPLAPDLPTMSEAGLPGFESSTYFGIFAPAGTPRLVLDKIATATRSFMQSAAMRQRLQHGGAQPLLGTPREWADIMIAEKAKWSVVIRDANIRM